jgi:amino acid transporter
LWGEVRTEREILPKVWKEGRKMNRKGDIPRYIIWFIVLMIILVLGLIIFYLGGLKIIQGFLENTIFG